MNGDGRLRIEEFTKVFTSLTGDKLPLDKLMERVAAPAVESFDLRQPPPPSGVAKGTTSKNWCEVTFSFALLTVICYFALNHHEVRKNFDFLPATCEPYSDGQLRPQIRPYRHCSQACGGCYRSWTSERCSTKMRMHYSINEYEMEVS